MKEELRSKSLGIRIKPSVMKKLKDLSRWSGLSQSDIIELWIEDATKRKAEREGKK